MSSTYATSARAKNVNIPWARVAVAGLVASVVMGMITMMWEAVAGHGLWAPLVYIGATVLGDTSGVDAAHVVVGLMGHMMNSVVLALVFGLVAYRVASSRFALAMVGALYGLVVFVVMWTAIVPAVDPAMLRLNGFAFAVSHVMWGAALGLVAARGP